ncbi:hypothetical protein [Hoyosella altamirensis]|uniref:Uncharacterized protein n=1 Tax=Hoyosella altamirensis TaxID=616997 RepID=A0A839RIE0_9ACTN|nr:hypothetical protein [Hoyosella altamirensis]MBB3036572.1 hypothetical protein [Hoyosella altamirensis]
MPHDRREALRRKYLSLGVGELVAAAVFAVVLPRLTSAENAAAMWCALVPLLVILVQASVYWLAARRWVHSRPMPARIAAVYRGFRAFNVALLAAGLIGILVWMPSTIGAALLVLAVWAFGVVEYVNYFVVRLSYPVGSWLSRIGQWRTPRLVQDIQSSEPR